MMSKLENGKEFKNYKELCAFLDWTYYSGGNGKIAQFKDLDTMCKWHKEGNKIIIDEVFNYRKKKKDDRSKRSANYMDNIETIILGELITNGSDNRLAIGKSVLLRECGLTNINFSYCKKRPHKVAKALDCDLATVSEYFSLNNKVLIADMEKALKNLRTMRLIQFNTIQMICKIDTDFDYKYNIEIDEFDEETENININNVRHTFTYEVATEEERKIIVKAEKKVLSEMNCRDIRSIFATNRAKVYYDKVKKLVRNEIPNFHFSYGAYDIVFTYEFVVEELQRRGFDDWFKEDKENQQHIINSGAMNKIVHNATDRKSKAIRTNDTKNKHRHSKKYVDDTTTLNDNLIDKKAKNIKKTIKKTKIEKGDKVLKQLTFDDVALDTNTEEVPF